MKSPEEIIRTSESATCATINALGKLTRPRRLPLLNVLTCISPVSSLRDARNAGSNPNTTPVRTQTPNANPRTRALATESIGKCCPEPKARVTNALALHLARMSPSAPPISASNILSVNSWRINRERAAPSATRTENSRRRAAERASNRFAMLRQAIRRIAATIPMSKCSGVE